MILRPASQLTKAEIESLISNSVLENRQLEYKAVLPGNSDNDKKEFLADVSAFANTVGGHIIFGLGEIRSDDGGNTGQPTYLGLDNINVDLEKRRLEQILQYGIEPAISGVQIGVIDGFEKGPLLAISIPQSWGAPHVVTYKDTSRFFLRTNAGKSKMDVPQIRNAFLNSAQVTERVSKFRSDRIALILNDKASIPVSKSGMLVVHFVPLTDFMNSRRIDVSEIRKASQNMYFVTHASTSRFNLDGYLKILTTTGERTGSTESYLQFFRNGAIEAVDCFSLKIRSDEPFVASPHVETTIGELVALLPAYAAALQLEGPYMLCVSLLNVKGYKLETEGRFVPRRREPVFQDHLELPELLVTDLSANAMELIKPTIDSMWNALGEERCVHYDSAGKWKKLTVPVALQSGEMEQIRKFIHL